MKTVAEYAAEHGISTTTVYNRVSKGVLKGFKRAGTLYIADEKPVSSNPTSNQVSKGVSNPSFIQELFGIIQERDKEIEALRKEIKRLTKKLEKSEGDGKEILLQYIHELKQIKALPEEIIEPEIVEPKKKRKKKKKKKKGEK